MRLYTSGDTAEESIFSNNGTMTVNMEQAQTAAKAANNYPEYTAFCTREATTLRLVNAKLSFDLP